MVSDPGQESDDMVVVDPHAAREALGWSSAAEKSSGLLVPVPEGWEALVDPSDVAVVVLRPVSPTPASDDGFTPNVTLTVEQPPDDVGDLDAYSRQLLAGLFRYLTDAHVVSVDPQHFGGYEGRRVVSGHRQGPFTLVTEQYWSIAESGVATVLTGTCTIEQYRWASGLFEQVAMGTTTATTLPVAGDAGTPS